MAKPQVHPPAGQSALSVTSEVAVVVVQLQGGDQAVRRLDTNAYLGVSDRQSRQS